MPFYSFGDLLSKDSRPVGADGLIFVEPEPILELDVFLARVDVRNFVVALVFRAIRLSIEVFALSEIDFLFVCLTIL